MFLASFRHVMGNTKRFEFLLTNDKFQTIPSLSTYNNSLETLRSSQLMPVPACYERFCNSIQNLRSFMLLESDKMASLWASETFTSTFYLTFSSSRPNLTTFDSMLGLQSDQLNALVWRLGICILILYQIYFVKCQTLKQHLVEQKSS